MSLSKLDMKEGGETHVTALEQPKGQNLFLSLTTTKKNTSRFVWDSIKIIKITEILIGIYCMSKSEVRSIFFTQVSKIL